MKTVKTSVEVELPEGGDERCENFYYACDYLSKQDEYLDRDGCLLFRKPLGRTCNKDYVARCPECIEAARKAEMEVKG